MNPIIQTVERLLTPVVEAEGVSLVDVTYQRQHGTWVLCLTLEKPGGITLDDCAEWSRRLGAVLDEADVMAHGYTLEVASPGLTRPLKKTKDFQRFIREPVRVTLYAPVNGRRNFRGTLVSADETVIGLRLEGQEETVMLPFRQIAKAHLDPEIGVP